MERFDVFDEHDVRTGRVAEKHARLSEGEYRRITEVWVRDPSGEYLIQRRSANKRLFPLLWYCTASGSQLAGEEPVETAIRETREELGLALDPARATEYGTITEDGMHFHIFLFEQAVDLKRLTIEPMEVADAALATDARILAMVEEGTFIDLAYYRDFFQWADERRKSGTGKGLTTL